MKYIVVTGGTSSGIGKGVVAASISYLLKNKGYKVCPVKFDGFLNYDIGKMNKYHSDISVVWGGEEVFVLDDGSESDLDIGVYERFLNKKLLFGNNISNGECWNDLLNKNQGNGEVIKIKPHLLNVYEEKVNDISEGNDICIIEVGGTIGDDESRHFIEYLAKIKRKDPKKFVSIHVSYIPVRKNIEKKESDAEIFMDYSNVLKPAKSSINSLSNLGLTPDIVVCRSHSVLSKSIIKRISEATIIPESDFFQNTDISNIYEMPRMMLENGMENKVSTLLDLKECNPTGHIDLFNEKKPNGSVDIKIVGNTESWDSFISLEEALKHSGRVIDREVCFEWVSKEIDLIEFENIDGVIITEGNENIKFKERVSKYCREKGIPILGISYGAIVMINEYKKKFGISEVTEKMDLVVGGRDTEIHEPVKEMYGRGEIRERHRHNEEILLEKLSKLDIGIFGIRDKKYIDIFSLSDKGFAYGVLFHPEYTSRPGIPNPIITKFLEETKRNL